MVDYSGDELPQGIEIRKDGKVMTADEVVAELQAARAQEGGEAPIVWINPDSIKRTMIASPGETVEVSAYREGEFTAPLYTHPSASVPDGFYCGAAICNGCGHVYMNRPSSCDCGNDESINGFEPAAVFAAADTATTPQPEGEYENLHRTIETLTKQLVKAERGSVPDPDLQLIEQRDYWEEKATELAEDVGKYLGIEVGEHSSANCPVQNAIDAVDNATPQPEDSWIKCSERLPTEVDQDICAQIWGWIDNKGIGGKWIRMSASEIKDMSENRTGPICKYWTPTGLKRPNPPAEG